MGADLARTGRDRLDVARELARGVATAPADVEQLKALSEASFSASSSEIMALARLWVKDAESSRLGRALAQGGADLKAGKSIEEVGKSISRSLVQKRSAVIQDTSVKSIRERIDLKRDSKNYTFITRTTNNWFDTVMSGGLRAKEMVGIGARQKGRKSSVVRNLVLGAALRDGEPNPKASIAIFSFENDQETTYFHFIAMLATRYLVGKGRYHETFRDSNVPINVKLHGRGIQSAYERDVLGKWSRVLQEAVTYAMDTMSSLPIWIYDQTKGNGNLKSLSALRTGMYAHKFVHVSSNQHYLCIVDYAQLARNGGSDYEDMSAFSEMGLEEISELDCTMIALSQFNEAGNWENANSQRNGGKMLDIVPTKGGGTFAATVHYYYKLTYDSKSPELLKAELALSRNAGYSEQVFEIHPPSGLILGEVPVL